ncbi:MAG: glycoside hydrolase family protein, partial [Muribaculaceae bacterium]|nr:glycoside hydrolase family protein [Muribaculaceae bacterium]
MNTFFSRSILLSAAALFLTPAHTDAKSAKRGLSENQFQFKAQIEAVAPGVSWYYNWGSTVGRYLAADTRMEYVPMCWNAYYDADAIRTYCAAHPEVKYLLGFNEPNFTNQANMTPEEAAAKWPDVRALADELGLQIVAPALNYSPNPPYQSPTRWMDEFVALVGEDAFDFTAIHSYGGFGVLRDLATEFHNRYKKPVWVTEFCLWP